VTNENDFNDVTEDIFRAIEGVREIGEVVIELVKVYCERDSGMNDEFYDVLNDGGQDT